MIKTNDLLSNEKCKIQYDASLKEISGKDFTDQQNEPRFFTTNKRGISKAWEALKTCFTEDMTMHDARNVLKESGIRSHTYCAAD